LAVVFGGSSRDDWATGERIRDLALSGLGG
jgi:hypothetical protein